MGGGTLALITFHMDRSATHHMNLFIVVIYNFLLTVPA